MIRIVLTIEEESPGVIRSRGAGEDVGGQPTELEVDFASNVMLAINQVTERKFKLTHSNVPLTIITTREKPNDRNQDRS